MMRVRWGCDEATLRTILHTTLQSPHSTQYTIVTDSQNSIDSIKQPLDTLSPYYAVLNAIHHTTNELLLRTVNIQYQHFPSHTENALGTKKKKINTLRQQLGHNTFNQLKAGNEGADTLAKSAPYSPHRARHFRYEFMNYFHFLAPQPNNNALVQQHTIEGIPKTYIKQHYRQLSYTQVAFTQKGKPRKIGTPWLNLQKGIYDLSTFTLVVSGLSDTQKITHIKTLTNTFDTYSLRKHQSEMYSKREIIEQTPQPPLITSLIYTPNLPSNTPTRHTSNKCHLCNKEEHTLKHILFACPETKGLRLKIMNQLLGQQLTTPHNFPPSFIQSVVKNDLDGTTLDIIFNRDLGLYHPLTIAKLNTNFNKKEVKEILQNRTTLLIQYIRAMTNHSNKAMIPMRKYISLINPQTKQYTKTQRKARIKQRQNKRKVYERKTEQLLTEYLNRDL